MQPRTRKENGLNETTLPFYENLLSVKASVPFSIPELGLHIANVGGVLLIAGTEEALKPFRNTHATFLVDSIDEFKSYLLQNSAEIIRGPRCVPTGKNMTVKHLDGSVIEYVEHTNG